MRTFCSSSAPDISDGPVMGFTCHPTLPSYPERSAPAPGISAVVTIRLGAAITVFTAMLIPMAGMAISVSMVRDFCRRMASRPPMAST